MDTEIKPQRSLLSRHVAPLLETGNELAKHQSSPSVHPEELVEFGEAKIFGFPL